MGRCGDEDGSMVGCRYSSADGYVDAVKSIVAVYYDMYPLLSLFCMFLAAHACAALVLNLMVNDERSVNSKAYDHDFLQLRS